MSYSKILVITDNLYLFEKFTEIAAEFNLASIFSYRYSFSNAEFKNIFKDDEEFKPVNIKEEADQLIKSHDLIISLHSKQLFPERLIKAVKCINIHPGFNPFNRGWFPQVFSILNKLSLGATIHEIDEQIDHGLIIDQVEIPVYSWDTSLSAYNRVIESEIGLIKKNIAKIIQGNYKAIAMSEEGNLNLKKDFDVLCRLDLNEVNTFGTFIDRLRALTHGDYKNAYFIDAEEKKIFVKIELEPDGTIKCTEEIKKNAR
jgi:dTDP-4-amino-4,6-dideoxyglucose formyltransferase